MPGGRGKPNILKYCTLENLRAELGRIKGWVLLMTVHDLRQMLDWRRESSTCCFHAPKRGGERNKEFVSESNRTSHALLRLPENGHLPFDMLTALSEADGLRYPHPSSLRHTSGYASFLGISEALHMDIFHQPQRNRFFDSFAISQYTSPGFQERSSY